MAGRTARLGAGAFLAIALVVVIGAGPALACGGLIGPGGTVQLSRTTTLAAYHNGVEHWSEFERGGHFPALEVPDLLVADVRAFFRRYR